MSNVLRIVVLVVAVAVALVVADGGARRLAMLPLIMFTVDLPPAGTAEEEGPATRWSDGWYTITEIDRDTYAIGEPLYHAQNYNYLILGRERAILFDSGAGQHDIRSTVASLTLLPVTAIPSHVHYDHVGNHALYDSFAMIDLPQWRERAADGVLVPTLREHLGIFEGIAPQSFHVDEWLAPGSSIDLGGRLLEVLHTPGHTHDSMALFDRGRDQLFIGDFITEGPVFLFVPGSSVGEELATAERLLDTVGPDTTLLTAHRIDAPGIPALDRTDLLALRDGLAALRDGRLKGSGWWPRRYPLNERVWMLTDFEWAQDWK